jgi:hypothetical protein
MVDHARDCLGRSWRIQYRIGLTEKRVTAGSSAGRSRWHPEFLSMQFPKGNLDLAHRACLASANLVRSATQAREPIPDIDRRSILIESFMQSSRSKTLPGFHLFQESYPFCPKEDSCGKVVVSFDPGKLARFQKSRAALVECLFTMAPIGYEEKSGVPEAIVNRLEDIGRWFDFVLDKLALPEPKTDMTSLERWVRGLEPDVVKLEAMLLGSFSLHDSIVRLDDFQLVPVYHLTWAYHHLETDTTWARGGISFYPEHVPMARKVLQEFLPWVKRLGTTPTTSRAFRRMLKIHRALEVLHTNPEWKNAQVARAIGIHPSTLSRSEFFKNTARSIRGACDVKQGHLDRRTGRTEPVEIDEKYDD